MMRFVSALGTVLMLLAPRLAYAAGESVAEAEGSAFEVLESIHYSALQMLWVVLVVVGARLLLRRLPADRRLPGCRPLHNGEATSLLVIMGVSLVVRLWFSEGVSIHENYCGVGRLTCATRPGCISVTGTHGAAGFALFNLFGALSGGGTEAAIALNAVLGGPILTLLVFALGRRLGASPVEGLVAAFVLAVTPLHIRISHSDSFYPIAHVCLVGGLVATIDFARHGGVGRVLLAAGLVALAVQTSRPFNLAAPLALLAFFLALPSKSDSRETRVPRTGVKWREIAIGVVAFFLLSSAHWMRVFSGDPTSVGSYLPSSAGDFYSVAVSNNLYLLPAYTPIALIVAWLVGLGYAGLRGGRRGWIAVLLYLLFAVVFNTCDPFDETYPTRVRMQANLAPAVALLAAFGLRALSKLFIGRLAVVGLVLASLVTAAPHLRLLDQVLVPAHESRFLTSALAELPECDILVIPDRYHILPDVPSRGDQIETFFPEHDFRRHDTDHTGLVTLSDFLEAGDRYREQRVLFYRGANLSAWLPEELRVIGQPPEHRPVLDRLLERYDLTPIVESWLPNSNPPSVRNHFMGPRIRVGFYELRNR